MSEEAQISSQDPLHYAPRWLRETPEQRPSLLAEARTERQRAPAPHEGARRAPASLDTQLENAVYESLRRPLDPRIIDSPPEAGPELDRGKALFGVAARFGAAIGISAIVALFFVFMVRTLPQRDGGSPLAAAAQRVEATVLQQPQRRDEASEPALAAFRPLLTQGNDPAVAHKESQRLLRQFMQWRQEFASTDTSQ
ncbi:MAG: hypothetical protein ACRECL_03110 [Bradyrhizobium sp.]